MPNLNKISNQYKSLKSRWSFDLNENNFIEYLSNRNRHLESKIVEGTEGNILVQMPNDYFYLCLFFVAIENLNIQQNRIVGLWHQNIMSAPVGESMPRLFNKIRQLFNFLDLQKWAKLYKAIGVRSYQDLEGDSFKKHLFNKQSEVIWKNLQSKKDLLDLTLNGTHCGDLIYDTYLRYRVQPTVDLVDPFLKELIKKAMIAQSAIREILIKKKINLLISSYSSYIQHGLPVREARRLGIQVFTAGNLSQYFKQLRNDDVLHAARHWEYGEHFSAMDLSSQIQAKAQAKVQLEARFKGGIDQATLYMKKSAYASNSTVFPGGIDGVVFLHDFFDSPHCYRSMLFEDFWEWANFTLRLIAEHKLNIAIKPHPNQLPESVEVVRRLKDIYPTVAWIDTSVSNAQIFASGIQVGISVYGTILHELAYHKIAAVAAGDHPHVDFKIAHTPTSIDQYKNLLLNYQTLAVHDDVQDEVLSFYYMHNIYNNEDLLDGIQDFNYRQLEQSNSVALKKFIDFDSKKNVQG